ncbi:MAG: dihydrodipicolinate synthase family protein [Candidatus Aminicenantales bacterium]
MSPKFSGVFAALTTPFAEEEIATEKLRENIQKYNQSDLSGYVVLGSTGECVSLSDEESETLVKTSRDAASSGKKVIAGTARESTKFTLEFTQRMADLGVDAALVRPPSYYKSKMNRDVLKRHYLTLADQSKIPLIIYNIPQNTGISLESRLIVELSAHPNIAGLKESAGNLAFLGEVIPQVREDFSYLLGAGSVFLPGLILGASGSILALADAVPGLCVKVHRLFLEGKFNEASRLQLDLIPLNKAIIEVYGIPGLKYALDLQDYYGGLCRQPFLPLEEKGKKEIEGLLRNLGLIPD